ncbi:MAG: DNA-processing protein DprA [Pseudomonadota bacterium]|nr:DNA-processing protein DprA [Pseudomonadota bacterium]
MAVIGTGINRYYPASNRELQRTLEQRGAVVSEFMPDAPPRAAHFPQRNRLISGISVGTLVSEATLRSGSLITARCAADQGREVFAMPGSPDGEHNRGGHQLLREGATLVETPEDILTELDGHGLMKLAQHPVGQSRRSRAESESTAPAGAMDTLEAAVLRRISMSEHLPADLMRGENLSLSQMSTVLMRLELAGRIQRKGGRVYLRE